MTYLSWAAFHEGPADALYFDVIIPKLMEAIIIAEGIRHSDIPLVPAVVLGRRGGRSVEEVANEICDAKEAFAIAFIHADSGGRALEQTIDTRSLAYCQRAFEICGWPVARCITVIPRHETEAWILADPSAVAGALGYSGDPHHIGLPIDAAAAERLDDPKATLEAVIKHVSGRRRSPKIEQLFPAIAQRQSIDALRKSISFGQFEKRLRLSLTDLGCIAAV